MRILNGARNRLVVALVFGIVAVAAVIAAVAVSNSGVDAAGNGNKLTHSGVYKFADGSAVDGGSATLVRTKSGVTAIINADDLDSDTTYTLWWVIFNNPRECENPVEGLTNCGEADLLLFGGDAAIDSSVLYAAGNVTGGTGLASFGAHLEEGFLPTGNGQVAWGPGLVEANKAEVHLVIRSHGPVQPELEVEQISSFGAGCTAETDPSGTGPEGPFACVDQQFAVFVPHNLK